MSSLKYEKKNDIVPFGEKCLRLRKLYQTEINLGIIFAEDKIKLFAKHQTNTSIRQTFDFFYLKFTSEFIEPSFKF